MQLRKMVMMLTALSALSVVMTGCPGDETGSSTCSLDADCIEGEICHPNAKVCVKTCTAGADCPSTAKTCAAISTSDSRQVCQCSTDALCNSDGATDLVCSSLDKVCTAKCTSDASCGTGRSCDTATGQCKVSGPKTCTPACTGNQVCDTNTGTCVNNGATCSGEGQSTCIYGTQFCSSNTCQSLPAPTCDNYTAFTGKSSLGTTGTIIYTARVVSATTDTAFCGNTLTKRVKVAVSAYSSTPFPASKDDLNGFFYVRVNGTTLDGPGTVSSSSGNYNVTGTNRERAEIITNLCVDPASTTTSTGYYFTSGNFFCFQANYP